MKKLLFTILLTLPLLVISCSDEDKEKISDELDGTTWINTETKTDGIIYTRKIIFSKSSYTYDETRYTPASGYYTNLSDGAYKYVIPHVYFTESGVTKKATISGNNMKMDGDNGIVYTKQ